MSAEEESKSMSMDDTAGSNNTLAEPVAPVATESTDVTAAALAPAAPASAAVADAAAMADEESDSEPMASGNGKRASRSNAPIINDVSESSESSGDEGAGYDAEEYAAARGTYTARDVEYQNESESAIACGLPPTYMTQLELDSMPEFASYSQIYVELRNTICRQWQKALNAYLTFDDYARRSFLDDDKLKASAKRVFDFLNVHGYINCGLLNVKQGTPQSRPKEQQLPAVHSLLARRKSDQNVAVTGPSSPIKRQSSNGSASVVKDESTNAAMDTTAAAASPAPSAAAVKSESLVKDEPFSPIAPATPLLSLSLNQSPTPVPSPELGVSSPNGAALPLPSPSPAAPSSVFKRIVVIGAGASGLAAARQLASFGHTVTVLEGRDRVGGRVHSIRDKFSAPVDLGASIMTGLLGSPLNVLCKQHMQTGMEVGFSTATTFAKATVEAPASPFPTLMHYIQHSCIIYDEHGVPVQEDIDHRAEAIFNKLLEGEYALKRNSGIEAEAPADSQLTAEEMDKMRLASPNDIYSMDVATGLEVCRKAIGLRLTPAEQKLFDWHAANLEYGCATSLDKLSLVYWDQDDAMAWEGDHALIKPGFGTFIDALRGENELDVRLGQHVKDIHYATDQSTAAAAASSSSSSAVAAAAASSSSSSAASPVTVTALDTATNELRSYPADLVLCTASLGVLKAGSLQFHPALPSWKSQAISSMGFGLLNKLILEFASPFWKAKNDADMFGWIHPGPTKSRGKFYIFWNLERSCGKPILAALCAGDAAFSTEAESEAALVAECMGALRAIHSEQKVPDPIVTHQTRWSQDEFARGSYSYLAAGNNGKEYDLLAKPVGDTLFFAGEACNRDYPATVPGAYLSGLRASGVMQAQIIGWNRSNPGPDVLRELSKQQKNEVLSKPDAHASALKQQAVRELFQQGASGENALQLKVAEILARQQQRRRHRGIRNDWGKGEGAVGEDGAPVAGEESMAARLEAAAQLLKRGVFNVPRESVKNEPEHRHTHIKRFEGELENPFAARVHDLQGLGGFVSFAEFAATTLGLAPSSRGGHKSRKAGKHSRSHKKDKHRGDKRDRAAASGSSSSSKKKEDRHKKKARASSGASSSDASSPEALIKRYVSKVVDGCRSALSASVLQRQPKMLSSVHHRTVSKVLQDWQSKPRGDLAMHLWLNDKRKAAIKELVERYLSQAQSAPSGDAAAAAASSSSSSAAYPAHFAQQQQQPMATPAFPLLSMDPRMQPQQQQQQQPGFTVAASTSAAPATGHQPRFFPSGR